MTRRHFLRGCGLALGRLHCIRWQQHRGPRADDHPLAPKPPPLPAKVKRVIYLHMSGAPPQHDLWDYKPKLVEHNLQPCPDDLLAILQKERLPFIDLKARRPKMLGTPYKFAKQGQSGIEMSELWAESEGRGRRAVRHQVDAHRPVQSRPGRAVPLYRLAAERRGGDGLVDHLWPGVREPGSAGLCRADQRRHRSDRRQGPVEHGLFAVGLSGRAVPHAWAIRFSMPTTPPA